MIDGQRLRNLFFLCGDGGYFYEYLELDGPQSNFPLNYNPNANVYVVQNTSVHIMFGNASNGKYLSDFYRIEDGTHLQFTNTAYFCREIGIYLKSIGMYETWLNHASQCLHSRKVGRIFKEKFGTITCKISGGELDDLILLLENDKCWKSCRVCSFRMENDISRVFNCVWQYLHRLVLQWKITDMKDPLILTPQDDFALGVFHLLLYTRLPINC